MASGSQDLKDKTLGQLEALRTALTSTDWEVEMMSASPEQKQQNSDVRILADARIAQLENVQLAQIEDEIDADAATLSDAIDGVQDALSDLQDVAKVLAAASTLLKVVGRVLASTAM
jgi:beta-phosphoglucomutase-like phosphatase (HAD superfamily)